MPRLGHWGLLVLAVGVLTSLGLRRAGDFDGYVQVGGLVLTGGDIYADPRPGLNTWPPFFSVCAVPLALVARLSPLLARALWVALNATALALSIRLVVRLVHARSGRVPEAGPDLRLASAAVLVPLLLTARYILSNFEHLQVNILVFALALAGLHLQATGRTLRGGICLGFAAALKVAPLLFVPYLAWRRRYRAAAAALAAAVAFSFSPMLLFGPARFLGYVDAWRAALARGWGVGHMNQSVFAMLDRLLGHGMLPLLTPSADGTPVSGDPRVLVALAGVIGTVVGLALLTFRGRVAPAGEAALVEWSIVFLASVLFAPVTWKAYLIVLLLPNTLLVALARTPDLDRRSRRTIRIVLVLAFLLGGLPSRGIVGKATANTMEMASFVTFAALLTMAALFLVRSRLATPRAAARGEGR